jgi:hypothetical protein
LPAHQQQQQRVLPVLVLLAKLQPSSAEALQDKGRLPAQQLQQQ